MFDPSLRENGLWMLRIEVTDSGGAVGETELGLIVDGQMKLGSYELAFKDAEWTSPISTCGGDRSKEVRDSNLELPGSTSPGARHHVMNDVDCALH